MTTDPIADMLTRIRNANTALAEVTRMPVSKQKLEIARILNWTRATSPRTAWRRPSPSTCSSSS